MLKPFMSHRAQTSHIHSPPQIQHTSHHGNDWDEDDRKFFGCPDVTFPKPVYTIKQSFLVLVQGRSKNAYFLVLVQDRYKNTCACRYLNKGPSRGKKLNFKPTKKGDGFRWGQLKKNAHFFRKNGFRWGQLKKSKKKIKCTKLEFSNFYLPNFNYHCVFRYEMDWVVQVPW